MTDPRTALSDAVSGENAAIYAYGVIGVHVTGTALALVQQAELDHRNLRDTVNMTLSKPPNASVIYQMPFPVTDDASALACAVTVEERAAVLWRAAVEATNGAQRTTALNALIAGAVRTAAFRRVAGATPGTVPFPGL
jgi:hypothetical protein